MVGTASLGEGRASSSGRGPRCDRCYRAPLVILVGLTGGIGAGKSTVSRSLAALGAVIVDADAITRALQEPGEPVLAAIVDRFGPGILATDGHLDRQALADLVFNDPEALKDLNGLVHPAVGAEIARRIDAERDTDHVVVLDVPLLVETGRRGLAGIVVVDTPVDVAVARLMQDRGMPEVDARARIARQASRDERLAKADRVIDNAGDHDELGRQVDAAWTWMQSLPAYDPPAATTDPPAATTEAPAASSADLPGLIPAEVRPEEAENRIVRPDFPG